MTKPGSVLWALALLGAAMSATPARAEFAIVDHLKLSVADRMRGEFVSWFDPATPDAENNYNFFGNQARVTATLSFPTLELVVEGQDTRLVNLPGSEAIATGVGPLGPGAQYFFNTMTRDQGETVLRRGFATVREFGLPGVSARVGRLTYSGGLERPARDAALLWLQRARTSQRLVGPFDYTMVGRSFDAAQALYDNGPFNVTLMAAHPTQGGFNVNANVEMDKIDLITGTASLVEPSGIAPTMAQFFYIYYADRRDLIATDSRPKSPPKGVSCTGINRRLYRSCDSGDIHISTLGADIVHVVEAGPGKADLLAWAAGQVGDWESLDQGSWGYALEAGYQLPAVPAQPWLRVGFFRSSGDHDATDETHETFFQIVPTARLYALFPYYNLMNNQDLFAQLMLKPVSGFSASMTGHWLRATESADLWYSGGGATSTTVFGFAGIGAKGRHELSYLTDLELSYAITKFLSVYAYYGRAFGQGVVSANFAGNNADYGYIETTVSF